MHKRSALVKNTIALISVVTLISVWWGVTALGMVRPLILPSPAEVGLGLIDIWNGYLGVPFINHFKASLSVMILGYLSAVVIGVLFGVGMAWIPSLDKLFSPVVSAVRPIPPPAWIPLTILWFGIDLTAKVFIVFVAAVVPCLLNSYQGIKSVPIDLLNAGRSLGAKRRVLLLEIAVPAALPVILGGLRIALGTAWATIVAAELVVSLAGFGFLIMNGYRNLESNIVFCGMLAVALTGFLMNFLFLRVSQRVFPWVPSEK